MTLHKVKGSPPVGKRYYSAPAAISIITGCRYERALATLHSDQPLAAGWVTGRWINVFEITRALCTLGWQCEAEPVQPTTREAVLARLDNCRTPRPPSLAQWLKMRTGTLTTATLLVHLSGHWLVVKGRKAADNFTPNGVFIRQLNFRRAKVLGVWRLVDNRDTQHTQHTQAKTNTVKQAVHQQRLLALEKARAARQRNLARRRTL